LNSKKQQEQIDWRRAKVLELLSKGDTNQSEIARMLQVDKSVISKDVDYLRRQARNNLQNHIQERIPEEYQKCITGINQVLKTCWNIVNKEVDDKTRLQALALVNDCNKYKMGLTTNGVVVTDAIKFVQTNKEKLTTMYKVDNGKESKEPDYDEDADQLEKKQEEETGEINQTTNHIF